MDPRAPCIVWFRRDLRVADQPALAAAAQSGRPVIPVYINDTSAQGGWADGAASRWWLHHSLSRLSASLGDKGIRLILRSGDPKKILPAVMRETGATALYSNRRYEPYERGLEESLGRELGEDGLALHLFDGSLLFAPGAVRNRQGGPFKVFTPFWRACLVLEVSRPFRSPRIEGPSEWPSSENLENWRLLPRIPWDAGFPRTWTPGEEGAGKRLRQFTARAEGYAAHRDKPGADAGSRLSPHLHFGEISPRQVWHAVMDLEKARGIQPPHEGARKFLAELGWREFAYHLLAEFPSLPDKSFHVEFESFPWAKDAGDKSFKAWTRGLTGYPIIDAGMRELWTTGWMHNRVRMLTASFLVKHLRINWTKGARWFWDTLVDADMANNAVGWQWVAGCGPDASPYFRVFAPVLQGEKFDPRGDYVRRWVPELTKLPDAFVHRPWEASAAVLAEAGLHLGKNYPLPMVDHQEAREAALSAYRARPRKGP